VEGSKPKVINGPDGKSIQSSVVSFLQDGTVLVGNIAKQHIIQNPDRTVYSSKRLI